MDIFNIGILGTGHIAKVMIKVIKRMRGVECVAVGSRNVENARKFAQENHIREYYGSYLEVAQSNNVDLIYIATVNSAHKENIIMCLMNDKPVLAEKPMCLNYEDTKETVELARQRNIFLAEAMVIRYLDTTAYLRRCIEQSQLNEQYYLCAQIGMRMSVARIREKNLGGGSLNDLGVYLLNLTDIIFREEPTDISASCYFENEVDLSSSIILNFSYNRMVTLHIDVTRMMLNNAYLYGTQFKRIVITSPHNLEKISVYHGEVLHSIKHRRGNAYKQELRCCIDAIQKGEIETTEYQHKDMLRMSEWVDRIRICMKKL